MTRNRVAAGIGIAGVALMAFLGACSSDKSETPASTSTEAPSSSATVEPTTKGSLEPQTKAPGVEGGQVGDLGPHS